MRRMASLLVLATVLASCQADVSPRTRVVESGVSGDERIFLLTNRDLQMRMSFPAEWEAMAVKEGDDLIARTDPKSAFGIAVYVPSLPNGETPTDAPWRRGALEAIRSSLESKSPSEFEWMGSEEVSVNDSPALQTTVRQKDGALIRDTYFFRENYLLTASLMTQDGGLDAVWPTVDAALQGLAFEASDGEDTDD